MMISFRLPPGPGADPAIEAFADQTHAWLAEFEADFRRQRRTSFDGGSGVLFACDVLVELFGPKADWRLFDVAVFERWIHEHTPDFAIALPSMVADLACFTNYLARRGRVAPEVAEAAGARMFALVGLDVGAAPPRVHGQRAGSVHEGAANGRPHLGAAERIVAMKRSRRRH